MCALACFVPHARLRPVERNVVGLSPARTDRERPAHAFLNAAVDVRLQPIIPA
jgi:hypothetical protein